MVNVKFLLTAALATGAIAAASCDKQYEKCMAAGEDNCEGKQAQCEHSQGMLGPATTPVAAPSSTASASSDDDDCEAKYNECRSDPGANISTCAADKAACEGGGSAPPVATTAAAAPSGSGPSDTGASESGSPSSGATPSPSSSDVPTGGAGHLTTPASLALALGLIVVAV